VKKFCGNFVTISILTVVCKIAHKIARKFLRKASMLDKYKTKRLVSSDEKLNSEGQVRLILTPIFNRLTKEQKTGEPKVQSTKQMQQRQSMKFSEKT
jgi:hypothetical protein